MALDKLSFSDLSFPSSEMETIILALSTAERKRGTCKSALKTKNTVEMQVSSLFTADIILVLRALFPE